MYYVLGNQAIIDQTVHCESIMSNSKPKVTNWAKSKGFNKGERVTNNLYKGHAIIQMKEAVH